jgi:DNA helicase TIP49 (TBP-interacting protein)
MNCEWCTNPAIYKIKGNYYCYPHGLTVRADDRYLLIKVRIV